MPSAPIPSSTQPKGRSPGADLLNDRVLPFDEAHALVILRILTDRGSEFCGKPDPHDDQLFVAINDIDHSKTKVKHPQTNGICQRFHKDHIAGILSGHIRKKPVSEH